MLSRQCGKKQGKRRVAEQRVSVLGGCGKACGIKHKRPTQIGGSKTVMANDETSMRVATAGGGGGLGGRVRKAGASFSAADARVHEGRG